MTEELEAMIDIETLDTKPTAVVLSIGLVTFTASQVETQFNRSLIYPSIEMQIARGRTISTSTLKFWMGQGGAAAEEAFVDEYERSDPENVMNGLQTILSNASTIWANGDLFDLGILIDLNNFCSDMPLYKKYNAPRDLRTLRAEATKIGYTDAVSWDDLTPHSAIDDCIGQIRGLRAIRKYLSCLAPVSVLE